MCASLAPRVGVLLATIALSGAAALAQIAPADAPQPVPFQRTDIADFGLNPQGVTYPDAQAVINGSSLFWDNGPLDNVTAHLSQRTSIGNFYAADDFFIKHDFWACIDTVTVCFAVSDTIDGIMTKPAFELLAYNDCSGRPDTVAYQVLDPALVHATLVGPSAFAGFNLWTVTFDIHQFVPGYQRVWLSVFGVGDLQDAQYYWLSANNGLIQGAQAQLKNGAEPWMDVQTCDCPGICTDLYFQVAGHQCCLAKNNTPFDPNGGAKSLQLKGATIDTARAVDNFQIGPYDPQALCAVEAWFATNCPLEKVYLEIYENVCNTPGMKLFTIDELDQPTWEPAGGLAYQGVPIYRLFWKLDGPVLQPGQDYWLSVVARGTGSILDKAYWMYLAPGLCNINITEGKVKDPYVAGLEDFTFVSVATSGPPRDFAFRLWTRPAGPPPPPPVGACCISTGPCVDLTAFECEVQQGQFMAGQTCATTTCPGDIVACCFAFPGPGCIDLPLYLCSSPDEAHPGETCATFACPLPPSACCLNGVGCVDLSTSDCQSQGGISFGPGTTCAQSPCFGFLGACCLGDAKAVTGCVDNFLEADCNSLIGIFAGPSTNCANDPCAPYFGACCLPQGTCMDDTFEVTCSLLGGSFSAFATCADVCPGACCLADGFCLELTLFDCSSTGGLFAGGSCAAANCPQPSFACCFGDGTCTDLTSADCGVAGGLWFDSAQCASAPCPPVLEEGACCTSGACVTATEQQCTNAGGTYYAGESCSTVSCSADFGACCLGDGTCMDLDQQQCSSIAGMFYVGVDCLAFSCPPPTSSGACCVGLPGSESCTEVDASSCASIGGAYYPGETCSDVPCLNISSPPETGGTSHGQAYQIDATPRPHNNSELLPDQFDANSPYPQ